MITKYNGLADIAATDDVIRFLQKHNLDKGETLREIAHLLLCSDYCYDFIPEIGEAPEQPLPRPDRERREDEASLNRLWASQRL